MAADWLTARGPLSLEQPRIAGILNVTPDSFWDGGRHARVAAAVARAEQLLEEGADLIDLGGESTRPGAASLPAEEEAARLLPVVEALLRRWPDLLLSIDTNKSVIARAVLEAGAAIINDVSALRLDPALAEVTAAHRAGLVLMHSRGTVAEMAGYTLAQYGEDVGGEVAAELRQAALAAEAAGNPRACRVLDPGLGFAKRTEHSIVLLAATTRICALGYPVLIGPSRKRFTGEVAGGLPLEQRLEGTIAACVVAVLGGARILRVHDVAPVRRALALAEAVRRAQEP
ncbi:MAG: dihydropteroate synthase [Gemmatimonadetes bacterium]|nr:dihydropteroate synthase [Gemmatimonadota bacterium]